MPSMCKRLDILEMRAQLRGPNNLLILHQIINNTLADEIAKPRPDMNVKVTAFTESQRSIIQLCLVQLNM